MKKHEILSPHARATLFDPPTEPAAIVRHYTFSPEDLALIRRRRRAANRLGFAMHLAYLRFPGCVLGTDERPPADMLAFIAGQIECDAADFASYALRSETRWEHLGELQTHLGMRPFRRKDARAVAHVALEQANGSDRGDVIVSAMIAYLREQGVLLPSSSELERLALTARAIARKRAYKNLVENLPQDTIAALEALLAVVDEQGRTPLTWLREWPEAPRQKNLASLVERLQYVRKLGVGPDRERRIHQARYAAIARETSILGAQHLSRYDTPRCLATLIVFVREMEVVLTDATLGMFDKMLGSMFRRADNKHKENLVARAKTLDASARVLLGMAKAMLAAKEHGEDQIAAVERALGWKRLKILVDEADKTITATRPDNLGEIVERHVSVRRMTPLILGAFVFRACKESDSLLAPLDVLRRLHANGSKKLPPHPPIAFLKPA